MQKDNGVLWPHGMIVEGNRTNHNRQSYKVMVPKDRQTNNRQHKASLEGTNKNRAVPQIVDYERHLPSGRYIHGHKLS